MIPGSCAHCDSKEDLIPVCIQCIHNRSGYKKAYNILMDYWDFIPDDAKQLVSERIDKALGFENEKTTCDEFNKVTMVPNKAHNSPLKAVSHKIGTPHPDTIKNALKRLRDTLNYGIRDEL